MVASGGVVVRGSVWRDVRGRDVPNGAIIVVRSSLVKCDWKCSDILWENCISGQLGWEGTTFIRI